MENSTVIPTFIFSALVCWVVYRVSLKAALITAAVLFVWFNLVFWLGKTGFFATNPLFAPNIGLSFLILFELLRRVLMSKRLEKITKRLSVTGLILIQTYRVVGVSFLFLYARGVLPAVFAFPSGIGDIIIGLSAPLVAALYYFKKPFSRQLAVAWNVLGIIDLAVAVTVGILAFPRPTQLLPILPTAISTEPLSLYPLVMITLFAVPLAWILHLISLRNLNQVVKVGL